MKLAYVGLAALAFAAAGSAGCGDAPTCEEAIRTVNRHVEASEPMVLVTIQQCKDEKWSPRLRACMAGAKNATSASTCMRDSASSRPERGARGARRSDAEVKLESIKKSVKAYYVEHAEFPRGTAETTPAGACCDGPAHKCPADPRAWTGVWEQLDFSVDEPSFFQYAYEGDGKTFTATATGDLDCDLTSVQYILTGAIDASGVPSFTLTRPAISD